MYEGEKKLWRKGQASRRSGEKEIRSSTLFACINSPIFENVLLRWLLRSSVNCSLSLSLSLFFSLTLSLSLFLSFSPRIYTKTCTRRSMGSTTQLRSSVLDLFSPSSSSFPGREREREREKKIHRWREATYYFKRVRNTVCQRYPATRSFRRLFARLPPPVLPCPLRPMYYSNIWQ